MGSITNYRDRYFRQVLNDSRRRQVQRPREELKFDHSGHLLTGLINLLDEKVKRHNEHVSYLNIGAELLAINEKEKEKETGTKTVKYSSIDTKDSRKTQCEICYDALWKKVRGSLFRYCQGKGYLFLLQTGEDVFNETLQFLLNNPEYIAEQKEKVKGKKDAESIPEYAFIMGKARELYHNTIRRKYSTDTSIEAILSAEENERENVRINTLSNTYKVDNHFDNVEFDESIKKVFTKKEYTIAKMLIAGYSQKEIAKQLNLHKNTINNQVKNIKTKMACGILEFAK